MLELWALRRSFPMPMLVVAEGADQWRLHVLEEDQQVEVELVVAQLSGQ